MLLTVERSRPAAIVHIRIQTVEGWGQQGTFNIYTVIRTWCSAFFVVARYFVFGKFLDNNCSAMASLNNFFPHLPFTDH